MGGSLMSSNKGSATVFFVMALTVITAAAALVMDIGTVVSEKAILSSTLDAAALAGAQELAYNGDNVQLVVNDYISKNSCNLKELEILVDATTNSVEVRGVKAVDHYFATVFGNDSQDISDSSKAIVANISSMKGISPLAVVEQHFKFGEKYILKEGGGGSNSGNYGALALGGSGASNYRANLLEGYNGTISIGSSVETEPGNMAGPTETAIRQLVQSCSHSPLCTYDSYNSNCSRIIYLPIVDTLDVNGRSEVTVLGFATFFLEGVTRYSNKAEVTGRFIKYAAQGETSSGSNEYGTYCIKLVK
jgi:hypothetical protein